MCENLLQIAGSQRLDLDMAMAFANDRSAIKPSNHSYVRSGNLSHTDLRNPDQMTFVKMVESFHQWEMAHFT